MHLQGSLDNINLFSLITILSFLLLAPFTLATEGFQLTQSGLAQLGVVNTSFIYKQALLAAVSFHAYQQVQITLASHADWLETSVLIILAICAGFIHDLATSFTGHTLHW